MNNVLKGFALSLALGSAVLPAAMAGDEISVAEKRIFLDDHLKSIAKAAQIEYDYQQSGKPDQTFADKVKVIIGAGAKTERKISVDYLSGSNKVELPTIEGGTANPVILYFLEKDIRDMHGILGGQQAYFRKRIRLALAESATVTPVTVTYRGKPVSANEIRIEPYANDPLKDRFGVYTRKVYVFTVSDAVPGGVYELHTDVPTTTPPATPVLKTALKLHDAPA